MTFDPAFVLFANGHPGARGHETLADQQVEAEATLASRTRRYPDMIRKGRITAADAAHELHVIGAIADSLAGHDPARQPRRTASWSDRVQCLRREILIRRRDWPRHVAIGDIDQAVADLRLLTLECIHDALWTWNIEPEAIAARASFGVAA